MIKQSIIAAMLFCTLTTACTPLPTGFDSLGAPVRERNFYSHYVLGDVQFSYVTTEGFCVTYNRSTGARHTVLCTELRPVRRVSSPCNYPTEPQSRRACAEITKYRGPT